MKFSELKEGDYVSWSWNEELYRSKYDRCSSTVYWCMDRRAVFRGGALIDTFNFSEYTEKDLVFSYKGLRSEFMKCFDKDDRIEFEVLLNVNDFIRCKDQDVRWRNEDDGHNLRFQCSDYFVMRKGSKVSLEAKTKLLKSKIEAKKYKIESLKRDLEYDEANLIKLIEGDVDIYV